MTIAVLWREDGVLWCAADTRLVAGKDDQPTTDLAAKIYSIPMSTSAIIPGTNEVRQRHYWTQYGFVFAGAVQPAVMTAVTASTLLQQLGRFGERANPPQFRDVADLVRRLAERFMRERPVFNADGLFSSGLFGWCPYDNDFKVAHIEGRGDGGFRVEMSFPAPQSDQQPWLILGSGAASFKKAFNEYRPEDYHGVTARIPRRIVDKMVADGADQTVGGATSIGFAYEVSVVLRPRV